MNFYKYSEEELKQILDSIVIVIDTREKSNAHIISYLDSKGIKYINKKLDFGDYTAMIPANMQLGISRDMYFNNLVCIERKGSLEELSGNFTKDRSRIEEEFQRHRGKMILLVEGANYEDILFHRYDTKYDPKSFIATLNAFIARYNLSNSFIKDKKCTGNYIYNTLYYHVREYFK